MAAFFWWLIFFAAAGTLAHVYVGYPALVALLAWRGRRRRAGLPSLEPTSPSLSIVISTRDSAEDIRARVEDIFTQEYKGPIEILVGCDGSPEACRAASPFASRGVKVWDFPRIGKASVQNRLVRVAAGEIVLTTDVQARFRPRFLAEIVAPFADPRVGGVTGILQMVNRDVSGTAAFEGDYWSFEHWLRQQESDAGILLGVGGTCFAFRRQLYREIGEASDTDNLVPLQLAEQHYRILQQPSAVVLEEVVETPESELRNRTRSVTRSFRDYLRHPKLLNPFGYPGPFLGLVSHKILRYLSPFELLALWASAFALRSHFLPHLIFYGGLTMLIACPLGLMVSRRWRLPSPLEAMVGLFLVHLAFVWGTINIIRRKRIVTW